MMRMRRKVEKKSIAFNAQQEEKSSHKKEMSYHHHHHRHQVETSESESQQEDSEVEKLGKEYTLLMKKANHLVKREGKVNFKRFLKNKSKLTCYEYSKSRHVKSECYKLKKEGSSSRRPKELKENKEKHKGFNTQWDGVKTDSDASKNNDENALCFMAFEDYSHEIMYQSSHYSDIDVDDDNDDDDECEKLKMIEALKDKCALFLSKMKVHKEKYTSHEKESEDLKLIVNSLLTMNLRKAYKKI